MGMATFRSFEEIDAWKKARELVREIYALTNKGPFHRDFALRDQVRRASVSVMAIRYNRGEREGR